MPTAVSGSLSIHFSLPFLIFVHTLTSCSESTLPFLATSFRTQKYSSSSRARMQPNENDQKFIPHHSSLHISFFACNILFFSPAHVDVSPFFARVIWRQFLICSHSLLLLSILSLTPSLPFLNYLIRMWPTMPMRKGRDDLLIRCTHLHWRWSPMPLQECRR